MQANCYNDYTLKSISHVLNCIHLSIRTAIRVCHCNGQWGPVHCHTSLQLAQELVSMCGNTYIMHLYYIHLFHGAV